MNETNQAQRRFELPVNDRPVCETINIAANQNHLTFSPTSACFNSANITPNNQSKQGSPESTSLKFKLMRKDIEASVER